MDRGLLFWQSVVCLKNESGIVVILFEKNVRKNGGPMGCQCFEKVCIVVVGMHQKKFERGISIG